MKTTVYITRTDDMIRFGKPASVTLYEYPAVSRVWIRRVVVELPEGFAVATSQDNLPRLYRDGEYFELCADKAENPVIIDHTKPGGPYIRLPILSEGWEN